MPWIQFHNCILISILGYWNLWLSVSVSYWPIPNALILSPTVALCDSVTYWFLSPVVTVSNIPCIYLEILVHSWWSHHHSSISSGLHIEWECGISIGHIDTGMQFNWEKFGLKSIWKTAWVLTWHFLMLKIEDFSYVTVSKWDLNRLFKSKLKQSFFQLNWAPVNLPAVVQVKPLTLVEAAQCQIHHLVISWISVDKQPDDLLGWAIQ